MKYVPYTLVIVNIYETNLVITRRSTIFSVLELAYKGFSALFLLVMLMKVRGGEFLQNFVNQRNGRKQQNTDATSRTKLFLNIKSPPVTCKTSKLCICPNKIFRTVSDKYSVQVLYVFSV